MTTYQANKGGHAPSHLREAFCDFMDYAEVPEIDGQKRSLNWLVGQLWDCTDIMPAEHCGNLDLPLGSTYAQGVRAERENIEWAANLAENEAQEEGESEALVALQLLNPRIRSLAGGGLEVRKLAADQLRYDAYVKNKAADLLDN